MGRASNASGGKEMQRAPSMSTATASQVGSASSTGSSKTQNGRGVSGVAFFTTIVPIIPLMLKVDKQFPRRLATLGMVIEVLQLFGLVLNTHAPFGGVLKMISKIIYASHLPFWDSSFSDIGFAGSLVLSLLYVCAITPCILWGVHSTFRGVSQAHTKLSLGAVQMVLHGLSSFMTIPVASTLMSLTVCNPDAQYWATDAACNGALKSFLKVILLIYFIFFFIICYLMSTLSYDSDIFSKHALARSHSRTDKVVTLWKFCTVVLYHILHANRKIRWFQLWFSITCLFISVVYAFYLPYFKQASNKLKTGSYLAAAWVGMVAFLTDQGGAFTELQVDFTLVGCGGVAVTCLGAMMAEYRVSALYLIWKTKFLAGVTKKTPTIRPQGLPDACVNDMMVYGEEEGCSDLFDVETNEASCQFSVSYIKQVHAATDIELSTRYVAHYKTWTDDAVPASMLDECVRQYHSGSLKYPASDIIPLQLAYFTCWHSTETRVQNYTLHVYLDQCIGKMESSLSVKYHSAKLTIYIKNAIGMKDNTHVKIWRSAQKLHREVLSQMSTFWGKLLSAQLDTVQLSIITNAITKKREQANEEFRGVLEVTKDDKVIMSYALFLEQVMHDDEGAMRLRDQVEQGSEFSRRTKQETANDAADTNAQSEKSLTKLKYTLLFMLLIWLILFGSFFTFQTLLFQYQLAVVEGLHSSGIARSLTQQAGYYVMDLCTMDPRCRDIILAGVHTNTLPMSTPDTAVANSRRAFLINVARDLQSAQKSILVGSDKSHYPPLVAYTKWDTTLMKVTVPGSDGLPNRDDTLPGIYSPVSFWTGGYETLAVLRSLYGNNSDASVLSAYEWIADNIEDGISEMFSENIRLRAEEATDLYAKYVQWSSVLLAVALGVLLLLYVLLVSNFEEIDQAKLEALNLFTLIPKPEISKLQNISRQKLNQLDQKADQGEVADVKAEVEQNESESQNSDNDQEQDPTHADSLGDINFDEQFGDEEIDHNIDIVVKQVMIVLFVLCIAGSALSVLSLSSEHYNLYIEEVDTYSIVREYGASHEKLTDLARLFVLTGRPQFLTNYLTDSRGSLREYKQKLLDKNIEPKQALYFENVIAISKRIRKQQRIMLRLAASYYGTPVTLLKHIQDESWSVVGGMLLRNKKLTNNVDDLVKPRTEVLALALNLMEDVELSDELHNLLRDVVVRATELADERESADKSGLYLSILLGTYSVALAVYFVAVSASKRNPLLFKDRSLRALGSAHGILIVGSLVVTGITLTVYYEASDITANKLIAINACNNSMSDATELMRAAWDITWQPDHGYSAYEKYWKIVHASKVYDNLKILDSSHEREDVIVANFESSHKLCMIAMTLHFWADSAASVAKQTHEISGLMWDFKAEKDYEKTSTAYPEGEFYDTTASDAMLSKDVQQALAMATVTNDRFVNAEYELKNSISDLLAERIAFFDDEIASSKSQYEALILINLGLTTSVLFTAVWYLVLLMLTILNSSRQFSNKNDSQGTGSSTKTQICLGFLAALFCGLFSLQIYSLHDFNNTAKTLVHTSGREYAVATAQITATKLAYSTVGGQWAAKNELQTKLDKLEDIRTTLYFGEDRTSGSLNLLTKPGELFEEGSSFQVPSCIVTAEQYSSQAILSKGVDIAMSYWAETAREMLDLDSSGALQTQLNSLRGSTDVVLFGLEQSTSNYHDEAKSSVRQWYVFFILGLVLIILVVVVQLVAVFRPVISELVNEEKGTKLMLKMIPEEVRVQVPIIQEFLDNGQMRDTDLMELVNDSVNEISNIPIVAIDHVGTIIRFTWKGEDVFGWQQSEVIGANIKMLMPPEYAENHSTWLETYLRTGVRKVIGAVRRVEGYRKNGTRFPLEITVREHRPPGEDPTYIATIQDLTKSLDLEMAMKLNEAIRQTSNVPLISVDTLATITGFNKAAELCFGFTEEEASGQNVSILMPEEIAKHHDGYIASYIKSGIKKVINTDRIAEGQRKNGQIFSLVLSIKEIKLNDLGSSSLFLGYVRDRTTDLAEGYQHLVHTMISDLSPIPIVSISEVGEVLVYSKCAEALFEAPHESVLGKNVNMFMPPEIAPLHDGYLEAYLVSGKRTFIDQTRHVVAHKPSGQPVHLSVEVREVMLQNSRVYVAFMRDLSDYRESKLVHGTNVQLVEDAPIPIIKIDEEGIVGIYNEAAMSAFQYPRASIIGRNVSMLTPPEVAAKHDGFLSNYKKSKVKHLIGTIFATTAKRNDGSLFAVRLKIDEFVSSISGKSSFLAYINDIEDECARDWLKIANSHISHMSLNPIITMSQTGTVATFSRAASEVWGYSEAEVLQKNVKMLMPKNHAMHHDSYLAKYLKTGIKTVVDTKRVVQGKRKDDTLFPLELWVKEIIFEDTRTYVGYIQDLTQVDEIEKNKFLSAVVFKESLDSIIKIDSFGTILETNLRLQELAGYSSKELEDHNVKVIGKKNRLKMVTKEQKTIQIELMVEEINLEGMVCNDSGRGMTLFCQEPMYVGFMRDITAMVARETENMAADTLASLSATPLVAIDDKGSVIKFSKASTKCFGYTSNEIIGKYAHPPPLPLPPNRNVNIIMAPSVAAQHDGFLRAYRKLGVKKVIGKVFTSQGMRKGGEIIQAELHIKEVITNGVSLFVGHIRDCTDDVKHFSTKQVADAIFQRSIQPIVVMDIYGKISAVNSVCEQLFGYTAAEMENQNIREFMPDDISVKHDEYLAKYRKTRTKTVLGQKIMTKIKNKKGVLKPVELQPKEIENSLGNVYVAFVRPMEKEIEQRTMATLAESTVSLSFSPIIAITDAGIVTMWKNCDEVFGYTEKEMLGQNIKTIQQQEVAVEHNGYLKRYKQTKVPTILNSTRRLTGVRKNGQLVPVDVSVREAVITPEESFYVANIRDATMLYQEEINMQLGNTIKEMADAPIISINQEGIIVMWNRAAEVTFNTPARDALGSNVNFITPPSIRSKHDGFLLRYKKTRVKRVVGTSKQVEGWKDDKTFPLVLHLREVTVDGELNYFGYLKDLTETFKTQKAMEVNNQVVQNSPLAFISITEVGIVQRFSKSAERSFGYSADDIVGNNVKLLMFEKTAKQHDGYLSKYKQTGVKTVIDGVSLQPARKKDGGMLAMEIHIREVEVQNVKMFMGYLRDTTDKAGLLNEQKLSTASNDLVAIPMIVIYTTGIIESANIAACSLLGHEKSNLVGNNVNMLMPEQTAVNHDGYIQRYLSDGIKRVIGTSKEVTAMLSDGSTLDVELSLSEIITDTFHVFVGYIKDMRKLTELSLLAQLGNAIRHASPSPLITINGKGVILNFNTAAEQLFGFAEDHVKNRNVRILMPDEVSEKHDSYIQSFISRGGVDSKVTAPDGVIIEAETKSGDVFSARLRVFHTMDHTGEHVFVGCIDTKK